MAVRLPERPEAETVGSSPARRLSGVQREGLERHFEPTDAQIDLLRLPLVGRWIERAVKSRRFQFMAIVPNQIIFWLVIVTGLIGAALPTRNFSTVITWYVWFCVVFLLMVGVGRAWCLMCPFGGAAEWVQRLSFWQRHPISIGLHRKWPESALSPRLRQSCQEIIDLAHPRQFGERGDLLLGTLAQGLGQPSF